MGKEEEEEKVKFMCKFCGQKFKNMRALCGHKRSHSESIRKGQKNDDEFQLGVENNLHKSSFCEKCDKGFKTFRALNAHMRLHPKLKRKPCSSSKKMKKKSSLRLPNNTPREKRSVRRYKINTCCSTDYSLWFTSAGLNSSVSRRCRVDDDELKDIASCLLMLANGGVYSADGHVSDDSVASETMSVQADDDVESSGNNDAVDDDSGKSFGGRESGSDVCKIERQYVECGPDFNVQSESESYGAKTADKNPRILQTGLSSADVLDSKIGEHAGDFDSSWDDTVMKEVTVDEDFTTNFVSAEKFSTSVGLGVDVCKTVQEYHEFQPDFNEQHASAQYDTVNKDENTEIPRLDSIIGDVLDSNACDPALNESKCEFADDLSLNMSGSTDANHTRVKYACKICFKNFRSGQSLGGHRLHCGRKDRSESVKIGRRRRGEKKAKNFTCLVCSKAFGSGQALGGHMRAHSQANAQSSEKKNDAFDREMTEASEAEISRDRVPDSHNLPALVPVA